MKLDNVIQVNRGNARQNSYNIGGSYITRITENNNETLEKGKEIQNDCSQDVDKFQAKFKCSYTK